MFIKEIKKICIDKNLTLTDLAAELGITRSALTQSLNKNPSVTRVIDVAKVLDMKGWELLKRVEE